MPKGLSGKIPFHRGSALRQQEGLAQVTPIGFFSFVILRIHAFNGKLCDVDCSSLLWSYDLTEDVLSNPTHIGGSTRRGPIWAETTRLHRSHHGLVALDKRQSGANKRSDPQNTAQFEKEFLYVT